jgi:hypothetical protein
MLCCAGCDAGEVTGKLCSMVSIRTGRNEDTVISPDVG